MVPFLTKKDGEKSDGHYENESLGLAWDRIKVL